MNKSQIKLLKPSGWVMWKTIRLEALKNHPEAFGSSFEEESERTDADWKNSLTTADIFGAFNGQNILIGTAGFFRFSQTKQKHKGVMFGVYVDPDNRKSGVADRFISSVIAHAQKIVLQVHCTVVTQNETALKLYERHGFEPYGLEPRALKIGEEFMDEIFLLKKF